MENEAEQLIQGNSNNKTSYHQDSFVSKAKLHQKNNTHALSPFLTGRMFVS